MLLFIFACGDQNKRSISELELKMNEIAAQYVKLVLEIGLYKPDYVDAYYGPAEWKPNKADQKDIGSTLINTLNKETDTLLNQLDALKDYQATELETLRYRFLYKQILSIKGMIFIISGGTFPFDKEAKIFYDAEPPHYNKEHFQKIIDELNKIVPGNGQLAKRLNDFKDQFIIPPDKLDTVFTAAITECRKITLQHIQLPDEENFEVEYVKNKPWGAYNWYKGNSFSIIQVNTDLPIQIDRVIDLAAHEGYPGHHVFNTMLEKNFVKEKGWIEFSVYPLYSPVSLIAEGTANYGIQVVLPGNDQIKFEQEILFPLAGINPNNADLYYRILNLLKGLNYAENEAARNYLDNNWTKEETLAFQINYQLLSEKRAKKKLDFIDEYRSYVINYNLGEELVKNYIELNGGTEDNPKRRWELFEQLLSVPQTPSGLK
ncbi:MAG: hypothetical protein O6940_02375 [Ignavibacteria bacterium]|nr:hypothetical protein [Ignavibacteria bacterium]